jgi:acyl-homoserine lactone acylase PvdQ
MAVSSCPYCPPAPTFRWATESLVVPICPYTRPVPGSARWLALTVALVSTWAPAAAPAAHARDYSGEALNVLPPGQAGSLSTTPHSTDQISLYDGLTPKAGAVKQRDLHRYFKSAKFGLGGQRPRRVERPGRPGLRILRDRWDVPHVYGRTRTDVMFGSGWVTAADRGALMEDLRGPAEIATLDVPGLDAINLALSLRRFDPSAESEGLVSKQISLLRTHGRRGERVIADLRAYVEGINSYNRDAGRAVDPWTVNDVISVTSLIGDVFGKGGGDETRRAELLNGLQRRLGLAAGEQVWNDLRELQDPEAPVSLERRFPYGSQLVRRPGNAVIDDGSFAPIGGNASAAASAAASAGATAAGTTTTAAANAAVPGPRASNALLVSARRSANGHPLFVAGPQVGYLYPELFMEVDLHGGGIDARGATFPGAGPYVLIGRGQDFAWSATSAGSDVIDQFVETLCGNDTTYHFRGRCVPMKTIVAGTLRAGGGERKRDITFDETVHGPVIGYATMNGERVAISQRRSTRGRDMLNALAFADLNANRPHSPKSFIRTMSQAEFTFNWFYADDRDIAVYSSGRLPVRSPGVDPGLPTLGTGRYEWRGFLPTQRHPHQTNAHSGVILNWNNKPAAGFAASDSNWSYGSVQRAQLLEDAIGERIRRARKGHKLTLTSVVAAMNEAATQDLRGAKLLRSLAGVLETGPAPNPRAARMLELLRDWRTRGASRLDRTRDGKIDHPGAAIMDAAWPKIADAVMAPVLGSQVGALAELLPRDEPARSLGSSYGEGWYGYIDKDLRRLRGRRVHGPFKTPFCGQGVLATCRATLWAALDAAGTELTNAQGSDPNAWRADAGNERIVFEPNVLGPRHQMRWTNRPTFQQVIYFRGHRR